MKIFKCSEWSCKVGGNSKQFLWMPLGCSRRDCILCAKEEDKKRGRVLFQRLARKGFGVWVFTFPRPYIEKVPAAHLKELEKRFRMKLEQIYLEKKNVRIGYRQFWHPAGDACKSCGHKESNPTKPHLGSLQHCPNCQAPTRAAPHLNFIIPAVGWDVKRPDHIEKPVMVPLPMSISPEMLRLVKQAWADEVNKMFKTLPDIKLPPMIVKSDDIEAENYVEKIENGTNCVANCHYQWVNRPKDENTLRQAKHRLAYFARSFPAWENSLKTGLHRGRDFGLLTNVSRGPTQLAREKYRETIKISWLDLAATIDIEGEDDEKPVCPLCNTGTITQLDTTTSKDNRGSIRIRNGIRISGPFYSRGSPPKMEIFKWPKTTQKLQLLSRMAS